MVLCKMAITEEDRCKLYCIPNAWDIVANKLTIRWNTCILCDSIFLLFAPYFIPFPFIHHVVLLTSLKCLDATMWRFVIIIETPLLPIIWLTLGIIDLWSAQVNNFTGSASSIVTVCPSNMSAGYGFPPLSQSPNNHPNIFVYPSGVPMPIFVEASSIRNRPKLIRSLRVSISFRTIDILVVDILFRSLELWRCNMPWPRPCAYHLGRCQHRPWKAVYSWLGHRSNQSRARVYLGE